MSQPIAPEVAVWRPRVSIILLTYNHIDYTQQCLAALAANTPGDLYELIIVDNASVDGTRELLASLEGDVQIIYNDINHGFVVGCNQGAKLAQGDYILLLNNDAIPQAGWLEPLIDLADADLNVGIVGSKLIYPDGRLQEAGCIIFNDASGWNYGKGDRPEEPRYNFVREVDYCSGASLMIRRSVWEALGGFDIALAPAYYEDTDICFGARSLGYRVMYQPASEVLHHEGITNGTALSSGVKRYQSINREKFLAKWRDELAKRPAPPVAIEQVRQYSLLNRDKNILVIDPILPAYDRAAGSRRLWELLKIMRGAGHHVSFIARNGADGERYVYEMQQLGIEVYPSDPERLAEFGVRSLNVPNVPLEQLCRELRYDVVWLSFWEIGEQYQALLRDLAPSATFVADSVDVHFVREERRANLENTPEAHARARDVRERELAVYAAADRVVTVTEEDRRALLPLLPSKEIVVVPNVHPVAEAGTPGYDERDGLLFIGNFQHPPNLDGIEWFCREVLPRIRREAPEITLHIAGNLADTTCEHLAGPGVTVTGFVEDVRPLLDGARLSIAPLRYGGGLKGKVGEALAAGLPVVTTPAGAEGFGAGEGLSGMLVADGAEAFARAVLRAWRDRDLWSALATRTRETAAHLTPARVAPVALAAFANGDAPARYRAPLVSIVMLSMNELRYTHLCVDSLLRHTDVPYELICIDNGSTDGTVDYLRSIPGARVIANPKNRGFAPACNQGIAVARGDYVLLLNNDVVLTEGWLSRLLAHAERDPRIGIAGPVSNHIAGQQQVPTGYGNDLEAMQRFAQCWYAAHRDGGEAVGRVIGFCFLIRRALIQATGGLDERYGNGSFEDDDYCIRAHGAGFLVWQATDTFIHHFGSRTYAGNRMDLSALMERNWARFREKWQLPPTLKQSDGYTPAALYALAKDIEAYRVSLAG